jgi:cytidine deaminase
MNPEALPMTVNQLPEDEREQLLRAAREVAGRAHAPYSGFFVGAAVLTEDGTVYTGCNVENASYGLTNCAERTAIFSAVAGQGASLLSVRAIAVATADGQAAAPCGACRQVIYEFNPDALVYFFGHNGLVSTTARELLPWGFRL